jgi:lysophospholipid acyltransferase (LPLAT)-like uncharacterized protein
MGSAAPNGITLEKAWDKFRIPLPFARVAVALGAPLDPSASNEDLGSAVAQVSALALDRARMVASRKNALLRHARRA